MREMSIVFLILCAPLSDMFSSSSVLHIVVFEGSRVEALRFVYENDIS